MSTTSRGRRATRVVLVVALAGALLAVSFVLLLGNRRADAGEPVAPAVASLRRAAAPEPVGVVADLAVGRAVAATGLLVAEVTPPPPPPVACPAPASEFIDSWGFARSGGRRHQGVDMMAPYGSPVLAPVAGVVTASRSGLGGLTFDLVDAAGNLYTGAHLATLDVTGPVTAGQQIGTVGTSGNASTPHLHFEVHPGGGAAVNPFPYAHDWCTTDFGVPGTVPLLP